MRTLTPVLSLVIAVSLFFFFISPQFTSVQELQKKIEEYKTATDKYKEFSATLEEKLSVKNSRSPLQTERLDALVPTMVDETQIIVDLEQMAKNQHMLFGNITTSLDKATAVPKKDEKSTVVKNSELEKAEISFAVIGTYDQFKNFLNELESSLTLFEVTKLLVSAQPGDFQQFSVTVRTYALKQ